MAQWIELLGARNQRSRTYQDLEQPARHQWCGRLVGLHYETVLDSGVYDAEVNMTPQRVDNAELDGWAITANGWNYALGQPGDKPTDGWVGFGRRGHWFKFRLAHVGYLHWPTRNWQDVGGAPTYDRDSIEPSTSTVTIGPNDDIVNICHIDTWRNIWNTPSGGELFISWQEDPFRLKEEITINQAARNWIAANRPPTTPISETWFGFVLQVDWSDIPQVIRAGIQQDVNGDFTDDGEDIELRTAAGLLHSFLPVSTVTAGDPDDGGEYEVELRKRFWHDTDGNWYLLVGVRVDRLLALQDGDLVFDPTENMQVDASSDDAEEYIATTVVTLDGPYLRFYNANYVAAWRFVPGSTILQGATIDSASFSLKCTTTDYDTFQGDLSGEDGAGPGTFTTGASNITDRTLTTANIPIDTVDGGTDWIAFDVSSIIEELVGDYDVTAIVLIVPWDTSGSARFVAWDDDQANCGKLDVIYTVAGGGAAVQMIDHKRRRV